MKSKFNCFIIAVLAVVTLSTAAQADPFANLAKKFEFVLTRATLTNVDDAAGRWQHEGGDVFFCVITNSNWKSISDREIMSALSHSLAG